MLESKDAWRGNGGGKVQQGARTQRLNEKKPADTQDHNRLSLTPTEVSIAWQK
jgi:hypothetical protein